MPRQARHSAAGSHVPTPLLAALTAVLLIAALGVYAVASTPLAVRVTVSPADARVSAVGVSGVGALEVPAPNSAPVRVVAQRAGFATATVEVRPTRLPVTVSLSLQPARIPLFVTAEPDDALVSVYRGAERVLVGRRRVAGKLPAGAYRVIAASPSAKGTSAEQAIYLDRPMRLSLIAEGPKRLARTTGVLQASGRIERLEFSRDGSLLRSLPFDPPPPQETFALAALRRVPDAAAQRMRPDAFVTSASTTSVADPKTKIRYSIDAKTSSVWASLSSAKPMKLATTATPPTWIAFARVPGALVVGCTGGFDKFGQRIPAVMIIGRDGRVLERIDSPTCTALAVGPDGISVAAADTVEGRIRLLRLPQSWPKPAPKAKVKAKAAKPKK